MPLSARRRHIGGMFALLDIERRLPVWHAMSDLFLDTELQAEGYRRIAEVLDVSRYSSAELRSILENEVAPAFASNLLSVAGVWAGWSKEDVREIMLRSRHRRYIQPLSWLKRLTYRRHIDREWEKIERLLKGR